MGSTPRRVIPKTIKKVPIGSLLGTQYLGLDFGGGWVLGEPIVLKHGFTAARRSFIGGVRCGGQTHPARCHDLKE